MANGRCRLHGGLTPFGPASPHWKTGRSSKVLPLRLRADYHAALADPDLLALRDDLALVTARLNDLLTRVDTGESGAGWKRASAYYEQLSEALRTRDQAKATTAMTALGEALAEGKSDYEAWAEIRALQDQRARLVTAELARLTKLQQFVEAQQVFALLNQVVELIKRHVNDPSAVASIAAGIRSHIQVFSGNAGD